MTAAVEGQDRLRVTLRRVVVSEWVKLRSLRSSRYTLLAAVVVVVGFALLAAAFTSGAIEGREGGGRRNRPPMDGTAISLAGVTLAQMITGTLGVLVMAGEYSTGMIRSSLSAVPKRLPVLWAKVLVLSGVTLALMTAAVLAAFVGAQALLDGTGKEVALSGDGVLRVLLGAAVYLAAIGVLGVALGALLRSTAAAITTLFVVLLVLPGLIGLVLPQDWADAAGPYLPSNAGQAFLVTSDTGQDLLAPGAGLVVFGVYIAVLLAAAAVSLTRRDA